MWRKSQKVCISKDGIKKSHALSLRMAVIGRLMFVTHFEENMKAFKDAFSYNYSQASKRFNEAISEIDKAMDHLEKIKKALLASDRLDNTTKSTPVPMIFNTHSKNFRHLFQ